MIRFLKILMFVLAISAFISHTTRATTRAAASCNESDVQAAVNSASNGDTVIIPACSQTNWGSNSNGDTPLNVTKDITIEGAGQGVTTIGDNIYKGNPSTCVGKEPLINWTPTVSGTTGFRLTGITIVGIATDAGVCQAGHIYITGNNHYMQIDHVTITSAQTVMIYTDGDIWGVITTCSFTGDFVDGVRVEDLNWNGFSSWNDAWGDAAWNTPIQYGSAQGVYIENSSFTNTNSSFDIGGATDCFSGGHVIFRYNTVSMYNNQSHGADSDQRHRACRWQEIYNNTYTYSNVNNLAFISWIRGGTGVVYNNTITAPGYTNKIVQAVNCRDASAGCGGGPSYTPWGACNGTSAYDQNNSGGYRCVDQPGAGTSNLLGPDPSGTVTPANAWVGNSLDPIYVWNNTLNGSSNNTTSGSTNVTANRDYYTGTARPNYTPYTYPYPATQGSSGTVAPPTSLQATVQ